MKPDIDKKWFQARIAALKSSQRALALALSLSPAAVTNILNGQRGVSIRESHEIAAFLKESVKEVSARLGVETEPQETVPISGYIGADDAVIMYMESDIGSGLEEVPSPFPGYLGTVVRVKGDSMSPRYLNGELIAYTEASGDPGALSARGGREVVALLRDGRFVIKQLYRGDSPDRYTLLSVNRSVQPILNVALEWVAEIDWHKP